MKNKNKNGNSKNGFTIIEALISVSIFAVISISLLNLFNVVLSNIRNNRAIVLANSVILERLEVVRGMDFDNVKTDTGWVPAGPIASVENFERGGIYFTMRTDVTWADDEFDGLDPSDSFPFDYKKIRVRLNWQNPVTGAEEEINMSTTVVPDGLEGLSESKGGLYISVFDSQGIPVYDADILISSSSLGFQIENAKTDVNGNLWVPDLDPASDYHIEATKEEYSTAMTYAINNNPSSPDYNPIPEKTDAIVIAQKVSKLGFSIDILGSMNLRTVRFENPENKIVNSYLSGEQIDPSVVISGSNAYIVWRDSRNSASDIYMQKFVYSGSEYERAWTDDVMLKSQASSQGARLVFSLSDLYLVWSDQRDGDSDIYLQKVNTSNGSLMGTEYKINEDTSAFLQANPKVASDQDGDLYIVWEDNRNGNWDVYGQKFDVSSGSLWGSDLKINNADLGEQLLPRIAFDRDTGLSGENQNHFYVVWQSNSSGDFDLMMRKFDLSGAEVFSERMINEDSASLDQYDAALVYDGSGYLYATWTDDRNSQPDIYMQKISKDGAISFSEDKKINDDAFAEARRFNSSIFYGSDTAIYIVWEDSRNGDAYYNIYAAKVDSNAVKAWEYDLVLADTLESVQINPSLSIDSNGNAVTVWEDNRSGNNDVYIVSYSELGNITNGNIPIKVTSTKTKGTYPNPVEGGVPEFLPIPKYSQIFTSDAVGNINIDEDDGGLEWGSYTFEAQSPYTIKSIDLPSPISVYPGEGSSVVINVEN